MAILGYARVSTAEQTLDLQRNALDAAGVESVYEETASGKSTERPELAHCLRALREGDLLVVWRLVRLGRNLKDLVQIVTDLETRGVKFKSMTEAIDTSGPTGTLVFHMFAALAQFGRELLRERTLAGLGAARARGRKGGRPPLLNANKQRIALSMLKKPGNVGCSNRGALGRLPLDALQPAEEPHLGRKPRVPSLWTAVRQRAVKVTRRSNPSLVPLIPIEAS